MKDIFSGVTKEELEKFITHTDLTMNDIIKEKLSLPKNKD